MCNNARKIILVCLRYFSLFIFVILSYLLFESQIHYKIVCYYDHDTRKHVE